MKTKLRKILRLPIYLYISLIYAWGCLWYDKKYLTGRFFDRWHYSKGWSWIRMYWYGQKVKGYNREVPWPVPPHVRFAVPQNIIFNPDDMQNFHTTGSYFQGLGGTVTIGKGSMLAAGTGFITANHDLTDLSKSAAGKPIVLGESCWVGMNAVILPGVYLGPHTVVGAGAVVTKSFPEGYCVIAGNPAKKLRDL